MPGVSPEPYGDWRDITVAEALTWLRRKIMAGLVWLGLVEYREPR